jgi:hypothetical protein
VLFLEVALSTHLLLQVVLPQLLQLVLQQTGIHLLDKRQFRGHRLHNNKSINEYFKFYYPPRTPSPQLLPSASNAAHFNGKGENSAAANPLDEWAADDWRRIGRG